MSDGTETTELEFPEVRRILDVYFATGDLEGALDGTAAQTLFDSIAGSEKAREYFNRLALTDRTLSADDIESFLDPDEEALPDLDAAGFERTLADAAFESKLDAMLESEKSDEAPSSESSADRRDGASPSPESETTLVALFGGSQGVAATLAAAALAALVLGVVMRDDDPSADRFNTRSAASEADSARFARPKLELFCVRRDEGEARFEGTTDVPKGGLECPLGAELKLAYRNRSRDLRYAAFFGVGRDGTNYWYGPTPAAPEPVEVQKTDGLEPFGETIRLEVNHRPGEVRVHAVFSTRPIDFRQLREQLSSRPDEHLRGTRRVRMPGVPSVSTSRTFTVVDAATGRKEQP